MFWRDKVHACPPTTSGLPDVGHYECTSRAGPTCLDLRPLLTLQRELGPAVKLAAARWGVPPEFVVVV
jgi:hypothetical protein